MHRYESIVKDVCCATWDGLHADRRRALSAGDETRANEIEQEINGWIGVSCALAFLRGVSPSVQDMAKHFDTPPGVIYSGFTRLLHNGVFNEKFNLKGDKILQGSSRDPMETRRAWCQIAGIASGFTRLINC